MGALISLVVITLGGIGIYLWFDAQNKKRLEAARLAAEAAYYAAEAHRQQTWAQYQWALQNMTSDPNARANVVNYGRAWYGLLRGSTVTLYDELAISNDIKQAGG
jgi:type II secretory pathway pseudopilin PulG